MRTQIEAGDLSEEVYRATRCLRGDTLQAKLQQLSAPLEDVLTRLDMLPLGKLGS